MAQNASSIDKSWIKGHKSPYQLRDTTHWPDWDGLVVADAWFNNLTSALMIVAGIAWGCGGPMLASLLPFAMTVALALLIIDFGILIADLADPPHFLHSLRVMRFTSPLSVGVWGLTCYGISLGLAVIFSWILFACADCPASVGIYILAAIMRLCAVMAIVAAIVVICYKGVVFSCSSQPGVCQARWLTPFMVSDSLLMGLSVLAILAAMFSPNEAACIQLIIPMMVLLGARCITFGLLWQDVKERAREVDTKDRNRLIGWIVYGLAGVLPFILLFCGTVCVVIASLIFLCAGIFERNWIISLTRPLKKD